MRDAMRSMNGLFDRCKGYVNHVFCGLHDLWKKALRRENSVVVPTMMMQGDKEGGLRRRLNIGAGNGI